MTDPTRRALVDAIFDHQEFCWLPHVLPTSFLYLLWLQVGKH